MPAGPLHDSRLKAVEACLNDGRLDEAQRALTAIGGAGALGPGVTYLTTRLLFLRGRLDARGVQGRLEEVMVECPDFPEAQALLRLTSPPGAERAPFPAAKAAPLPEPEPVPPRSTTSPPRPSARPTERLETPGLPPGLAQSAGPLLDLGPLDKPRSELPTEPAPPLREESTPPPFELSDLGVSEPRRRPWDEVNAMLADGRARGALAALEAKASERLDRLLVSKAPEPRSVALECMRFLATAPGFSHFAPFDLSLKSLERLDAMLSLLAPGAAEVPCSALSIMIACYAGESLRATRGGSWRGRVAEPATLAVEQADEVYHPLAEAEKALTEGTSLRDRAGPPLHPGAEPPEPCSHEPAEPPTPWDPEPWPSLPQLIEIGRALPASAIGAWAARTLRTPLDRTFQSVHAMARYLALIRSDSPVYGKAERRATVLAGAYLGELICLHRAGRWTDNDTAPESPLAYEVLLPDGNASYPVLIAHHELARRGGETLLERLNAALGRD